MQTVRIICPKCKTSLNVSNINNEPFRLIACPQCQTQLRIKFNVQPPAAPPPAPAHDESETVIGTARKLSATYALECEGRTYQLADGVNTVGRQATTSRASLQIATGDQKMSRHHAQIQLQRLANNTVKLKISNWQNKNGTWVNGMQLADGEILFIEPGDNIRMGSTELTLTTL
ncbi:MAG: FHA domain-containing protein [Prevotella sp.]|nr:FHA domain-containing protein [Prevotella sp.]